MLSKLMGLSASTKVFAAVIVMLGFTVGVLWTQNGNLREQVGEARAAVYQAKQTNSNNLTAITDLEDRLDQCVTSRQVDEAANTAVVSELKADILDLEQRGIEVRIEREEIFREPSCEELGSIDINAVCPDLARSLRQRANGLNGG